MSFNPADAVDISPTRIDAELRLTWFSVAAPGTWFQVYLNRVLVWSGTGTTAIVPYPSTLSGAFEEIDVGSVLPSEIHTDFSSSLPTPPGGGPRILLAWEGGTFESATIVGFHVYLGDSPGDAIDYTKIVGTVPAYLAGQITDGFGMGGFGLGGFGRSGGAYSWTSQPLTRGTWNVGVKAYDAAGNEGAAVTTSCTVNGPPLPPARNPDGQRLHYIFQSGPHAHLYWLASPGY